MGNELASGLVAGQEVGHHEANDPISMRLLLVLEIKPIIHLSNSSSSLLRVVLQDHLFKVQECAFVLHTLSQLDTCLPGMWRVRLLAVIAPQVLDDEFNLEGLLEERIHLHFFLYCQLDFDPS